MHINRAKKEIKDTLEAYLLKNPDGTYKLEQINQRPILLLGAPGIGKTQIVEQVAKEAGVNLVAYTITHHTRQSAIGLPFIQERMYENDKHHVTEYTMSEIIASVYNKIEETKIKEGILFIDEINCVSETLAPAMLQFLQAKSFGNHKIPEGWLVVAAGNPPEYNKSVREFDVVTLDRIRKIEVEPDFEVWKAYAYQNGVEQSVIAYLTARQSSFYKMETTVDGRFFATPRGWVDISELMRIYGELGKKVDREIIVQYIQHPQIARDFASYLDLYEKYQREYRIEEILKGNISEALIKKLEVASFDERISVVSLMISVLNRKCKEYCRLENEVEALHSDLKARKKNGEEFTDKWQADKETFAEIKDKYDALYEETADILEHAFDFLEAAFKEGQEMVVFISELNVSGNCIHFIQEYECERYDFYCEKLLLKGREADIKARINNLNR